jgi:hypothetical protein
MYGVALAALMLLMGIPTLINAAARKSHDIQSTRFL